MLQQADINLNPRDRAGELQLRNRFDPFHRRRHDQAEIFRVVVEVAPLNAQFSDLNGQPFRPLETLAVRLINTKEDAESGQCFDRTIFQETELSNLARQLQRSCGHGRAQRSKTGDREDAGVGGVDVDVLAEDRQKAAELELDAVRFEGEAGRNSVLELERRANRLGVSVRSVSQRQLELLAGEQRRFIGRDEDRSVEVDGLTERHAEVDDSRSQPFQLHQAAEVELATKSQLRLAQTEAIVPHQQTRDRRAGKDVPEFILAGGSRVRGKSPRQIDLGNLDRRAVDANQISKTRGRHQ